MITLTSVVRIVVIYTCTLFIELQKILQLRYTFIKLPSTVFIATLIFLLISPIDKILDIPYLLEYADIFIILKLHILSQSKKPPLVHALVGYDMVRILCTNYLLQIEFIDEHESNNIQIFGIS